MLDYHIVLVHVWMLSHQLVNQSILRLRFRPDNFWHVKKTEWNWKSQWESKQAEDGGVFSDTDLVLKCWVDVLSADSWYHRGHHLGLVYVWRLLSHRVWKCLHSLAILCFFGSAIFGQLWQNLGLIVLWRSCLVPTVAPPSVKTKKYKLRLNFRCWK